MGHIYPEVNKRHSKVYDMLKTRQKTCDILLSISSSLNGVLVVPTGE